MELQFPNQLKRFRTDKGLSQEDVAKQLYISRQAVSRWESGDATPDLPNLIKLAEIFDYSLDTLVLGITPQTDSIEDKIDHSEFTFDPRRGEYIRRRRDGMNFWEFMSSYWWALIPIIAVLGGVLPDIIDSIKSLFN